MIYIGYSKDDFGCFRCSCIEDSYLNLKSTQSIETTKPSTRSQTVLSSVSMFVKKEPCSVSKILISALELVMCHIFFVSGC